MGAPKQYVRCQQCGRPDGWPVSRRCMRCAHGGRFAWRKYPAWTEERDQVVREAYQAGTNKSLLSAALTRATAKLAVPRYIVRFRASELGLTHDTRRPWTAAERAIVEQWAGSKSLPWIVRRLPGRSLTGLRAFMGNNRLRWKVEAGYSMGDVVRILGVSFLTVQKWRDSGLLVVKAGRVSEGSLRRLVFEHPELYTLRKVDEVWFKGVVFPSAACFRFEPKNEAKAKGRPRSTRAEEVA